MNNDELKQQYNVLLKRFNAGAKYLDDTNIPDAEREPKVPAFRRIVEKLNAILFILQENGVSCTDEEILKGFKLEGEVIDK